MPNKNRCILVPFSPPKRRFVFTGRPSPLLGLVLLQPAPRFSRKRRHPMTSHKPRQRSRQLMLRLFSVGALVVSTAAAQKQPDRAVPKFSSAVASDVSPPARDLALAKKTAFPSSLVLEIRPERGPVAKDKGFSGDAA